MPLGSMASPAATLSTVSQLPLELRLIIYYFIFDTPSIDFTSNKPTSQEGPERIAIVTARGHQTCRQPGYGEVGGTTGHPREPVAQFSGDAKFLASANLGPLGRHARLAEEFDILDAVCRAREVPARMVFRRRCVANHSQVTHRLPSRLPPCRQPGGRVLMLKRVIGTDH